MTSAPGRRSAADAAHSLTIRLRCCGDAGRPFAADVPDRNHLVREDGRPNRPRRPAVLRLMSADQKAGAAAGGTPNITPRRALTSKTVTSVSPRCRKSP
jgi:hypothetical protein